MTEEIKVFEPDHEGMMYETEYEGMPIQIIDEKNIRYLRFGNSIKQSSIDKNNPLKLQTKYTRDMMGVFDHYKDIPETILVLGLGAGTIPTHLYHKFPKTKIYVVEIIEELKDMASFFFCMPKDERIRIINRDAFLWIFDEDAHPDRIGEFFFRPGLFMSEGGIQKFDLIFMDVFDQNAIPERLCSELYYKGLKKILTKNGYVIFNTWIDPSSYDNYIKKLENVFGTVIEESVPKSGNHIAFCKRK